MRSADIYDVMGFRCINGRLSVLTRFRIKHESPALLAPKDMSFPVKHPPKVYLLFLNVLAINLSGNTCICICLSRTTIINIHKCLSSLIRRKL